MVGTGEFYDIAGILTSDDQIHIRDINHPIVETGRVLSTPSHYAYLKISEGCDKHCYILHYSELRGKHRSRPDGWYRKTKHKHSRIGVWGTDFDCTGYGRVRNRSLRTALIICAASQTERIFRPFIGSVCFYVYPETIDDALIETMKKLWKGRAVYRHSLAANHRPNFWRRRADITDEASIHALIKKLRDEIPQIVIRSTFITGFPGETEEEHRQLVFFLREAALEKVGVFRYSQERVRLRQRWVIRSPKKVKQRRYDELMSVQESISNKYWNVFLDCEWDVIAEDRWMKTTYSA
jgi:ribosomal protein S12 methylthiotransferase